MRHYSCGHAPHEVDVLLGEVIAGFLGDYKQAADGDTALGDEGYAGVESNEWPSSNVGQVAV